MMKYKSIGRRMVFEDGLLDILRLGWVNTCPNSPQAEDYVNEQVG
jgi:hypothetical protein